MTDLSNERRLIAARRARREYVETVRVAMNARAEHSPESIKVTTYRCSETHVGTRNRPVLAKVFRCDELPVLFVSRIQWMPSDELTLRPWVRHDLLGHAMDDATFERLMTDDDLLERTLQNYDSWSGGHQATGQRWLQDMPPTHLHEVVTPVPALGSRELWIRCPRCAATEVLNSVKMLNDTRT